MAKSFFDELNSMTDEIDADAEELWEKGSESISNNNKLSDILYDTFVASVKEYFDETNKLGEDVSDSMATAIEKGVPMEYFDDMALKPEMNDVHQQIVDDFDDKLHQARMHALKDPVTVGGTVVAGVTGSAWLLPLATAPFMVNDLSNAAKQGQGGKATANMALPILASSATNMLGGWGKLAKLSPMASKVLTNPLTSALVGTGAAMTDDNTRQWAMEHPGRAAFLFGGVDAIRGVKAGAKRLAEPSVTPEVTPSAPTPTPAPTPSEPTPSPTTEPTPANKVVKDVSTTREGMIKPQETQPKPKTTNELAFPETTKENVETTNRLADRIVEEVMEDKNIPSVMQGAFGKELTYGTERLYNKPVSVEDVWQTAQSICPALPTRVRAEETTLGYYKVFEEHIRVRGFKAWSTLCHELGHHSSKKLNWGRSTEKVKVEQMDYLAQGNNGVGVMSSEVFELKQAALSIWKNGEYGNPNTPEGHKIYIEEGRAAFVNEYLINPEMARADFPLATKSFEEKLALNPDLQARYDLLGQQIRKWGNDSLYQQMNSTLSYADRDHIPLARKLSNALLKVETATLDEFAPLQKVVKDFLLNNPNTQYDNEGYLKTDSNGLPITKPKELKFEDNPANVAQRAKEGINSTVSCLMGESGIDTPTIIQAVSNKYGVALNPVTMKDVLAPLREFAKTNEGKEWLKKHGITDEQGMYEAFSSYMVALHELEVIGVQNDRVLKGLKENIDAAKLKITEIIQQKNQLTQETPEGQVLVEKYNKQIESLEKKISKWEDKQTEISMGRDDYLTTMKRKELERIVSEGESTLPFTYASMLFHDWNENILRLAVAGDIIRAEDANYFLETYPNYVPMKRSFAIEGNTNNTGVGRDATYANISNAIHALSKEGSERSIKDPIVQSALNLQNMVSKIERNKVAKAVVELSKTEGGDKLLEPLGKAGTSNAEQIITVMDKGEKYSYQCIAPGLYDALAYSDKATQIMQLNVIESLLKGTAQTLRKGATSTPAFAIANMVKDLLNATTLNKDGRKTHLPILDQALLLWDGVMARADKEMLAEYKAEGVQYTSYIGQGKDINMGFRDFVNDPHPHLDRAGKFWDAVTSIVDVGEQLPRMGLYRRARLRGASPFEAASIASDGTTNFMRTGTHVKQINRYIPFFNAVLQGNNKVLRAFKEDPVGVGLSCFTYLTLPALACWYNNHDKDWYRNMPLSKKNKYYYWDFSSEKDGSMVMALPKNEILGYAFASCVERMLDFAIDNDKDGQVINDTLKETLGQMIPSGFPTALLPIIEWQANYSFFRGKPIVDMRMTKVKPEDQYNLYTSEVAKFVGKKTGLSPMKIDNTIYDLTGTMGYLVTGLMDYGVRELSDDIKRPAKKWTEHTRFTYTDGTSSSRSADVFYNGLDRLEAEYGSAVKNAGEGAKPKVPQELEGMRKALAAAKEVSLDIKGLDKMYMSPEDKRAARDKLVKERDNIFRFANKNHLGYKYIQSPESMPRAKPPKKKATKPTRKRKTTKK